MTARRPLSPVDVEIIKAMASKGATGREISERTGIARGTVNNHLRRMRNNGTIPPASEPHGRHRSYSTVTVPNETLERLKAEATRRGVPLLRLAARILDTVAKDQLFDAVLDTDEPKRSASR